MVFGRARLHSLRENGRKSSFRAKRGIPLRRIHRERGIPHSADSVRNDGVGLFPHAVKPCPPEDHFWESSQFLVATLHGRPVTNGSRVPLITSICFFYVRNFTLILTPSV